MLICASGAEEGSGQGTGGALGSQENRDSNPNVLPLGKYISPWFKKIKAVPWLGKRPGDEHPVRIRPGHRHAAAARGSALAGLGSNPCPPDLAAAAAEAGPGSACTKGKDLS